MFFGSFERELVALEQLVADEETEDLDEKFTFSKLSGCLMDVWLNVGFDVVVIETLR